MKLFQKCTLALLLLFFSTPLIADVVTNADPTLFKKHQITFGFYDENVLPNNIPHPPHPLFWTSRVDAQHGGTINYQWNVFHTEKYFSVNLGTSLSAWSAASQTIVAASFFFVLRVWLFRTSSFSPYIQYSIAGPTLLSRRYFATSNLGGHFIFQDFIGIGAQIGEENTFNVSLDLYHYSNGDLFEHNGGFDVPVVLSIGYSF